MRGAGSARLFGLVTQRTGARATESELPASDLFASFVDVRSFASIWYWLALAVLWSVLSHWVVGVPYDMVWRARRGGATAMADLETMVRLSIRRHAALSGTPGVVLLGVGACGLTMLGLTGFLYHVEFCQALFLMLLPLALVIWLRMAVIARITRQALAGDALCRRLTLHRVAVQAIGIVAIVATSLWGMFQNILATPF